MSRFICTICNLILVVHIFIYFLVVTLYRWLGWKTTLLLNVPYVICSSDETSNSGMNVARRVHLLLPVVITFLALAVIVIFGDILMSHPRISNNAYRKALADNGLHAVIAALGWSIVGQCEARSCIRIFVEAGAAGAVASFIDLDHFFAARSFSIHSATKLRARPPLHCTTPFVVLFLLVQLAPVWLHRFAWLFLLASTSHHVRDGLRHGMWLAPFGHTLPVPFTAYVVYILAIPLVCVWGVPHTSAYNKLPQSIV